MAVGNWTNGVDSADLSTETDREAACRLVGIKRGDGLVPRPGLPGAVDMSPEAVGAMLVSELGGEVKP